MTHYYYPMQPMQPMPTGDQQQWMQPHYDMNLLMNAAKTGAMIGATGAAAVNLHRMRNDQVNWQQALTQTVKVGLSAGAATAAATAVGRIFSHQRALSLAATLVTGTAVMYVLTGAGKEPGNE
jgi:predicted deacylase